MTISPYNSPGGRKRFAERHLRDTVDQVAKLIGQQKQLQGEFDIVAAREADQQPNYIASDSHFKTISAEDEAW